MEVRMISNELSTIQAKDCQRAEIAKAMAGFQGDITVIETPVVRPEMPSDWRRTLNLPGSADALGLDQQEAAMVSTIRDLAAKGAGISAMQKALHADPRRIRMLARKAKIEIPDARAKAPRSIGCKARMAVIEARTAKRAVLAVQLAPLAANGLTIQAMGDATGASKRRVLATLEEHNIVRGPKTKLEA
jgi:hypothetical protein